MVLNAVLLTCILGCATVSATPEEMERGRALVARRQYQKAIAIYQRVLSSRPADTLALAGLGMAYTKKRDWAHAVDAWSDLRELTPYSIEANTQRWFAIVQNRGEDPEELGEARRLIERESDSLVEEAAGREVLVSLAYDALRIAQADSEKISRLEDLIVDSFPQSLKAYEIAREKFYDGLYPIWRNDTLKVDFLLDFLTEYGNKEWQFKAYQFLLSSLKRLDREDLVVKYGEKMVRRDSLNPFSYEYLSYLLLDMGIEPQRAFELASKAVHLEPHYVKPVAEPPEQWELEKEPLPAVARREVATALIQLGRLDEAEKWIEDAIRRSQFSVNNYATAASFYYTLGRIKELEKDTDGAIRSYVEALREGDMTNKWSEKADSSLRAIYAGKFGSEDGIMNHVRGLAGYSGVTFTDVTEKVGLGGRKESRVAWGDFNNDGFDDILLSGRTLFLNCRGDSFTDHTEKSGIEAGGARGAVCADFDNDGNLDFYAISGGKGESSDRLWKGGGDGTFVDVTHYAGNISDTFSTEGAAWGDYDADGYVDLYCANYEVPRRMSGLPDFLYRNRGDGTFEDATERAGIEPPFGEDRTGRGVNWGDFDNDGDLDVYVCNYRLQENFLFQNNGDGTFTNAAANLGVAGDERDGWWGHTIGSEWGDYDGDGDLDLVTANLAHPRYIEFSNKTRLYENSGFPQFSFVDRRESGGIKYDETHSDPSWGDVDADGDLDLFLTSIYEDRRSFLYENLGRGRFRDITWFAGVRTFNGWGCAFSDYDKDGDLDLFVASGSGCRLYSNDGCENRWLEVELVGGEASNRAAIGARITAVEGKRKQIREVEGGKGTTSQHSLVQFFGFGKRAGPVDVIVRFPSGVVVRREDVSTNQRITVTED